MPPFWVTRKPPSARVAAAFAPPPTVATGRRCAGVEVDAYERAVGDARAHERAVVAPHRALGEAHISVTHGSTGPRRSMRASNAIAAVGPARREPVCPHVSRILLLVRHGQSTWNADGRWQGQADPPLSPLGERQAAAAAPRSLDARRRGVGSDLERARADRDAPRGPRASTSPSTPRAARARRGRVDRPHPRRDRRAVPGRSRDAHGARRASRATSRSLARVLPRARAIVGDARRRDRRWSSPTAG